MKTKEQEALDYEIRSVGMTIDQAREHILASQSYMLESPERYVLGQLASIQDLINVSRYSEARHVMNRLRMALVENFNITKKNNTTVF